MYYNGSFLSQKGETITVHIVTGADKSREIIIGDEGSGIYFPAESPVVINNCINDTFDVLLRSSATVKLQTRDFLPDLFSKTCRDTVINIFKGGKCVFAGFVDPQTYSQGFNDIYDEIELSCIDMLTALQYSKYGNAGWPGVDFDQLKGGAGLKTFKAIMGNILGAISAGIDITGESETECLYDGSRSLTSANADRYEIFSQISVSDLLFMNGEEDAVWSQDEVLEAMLKYLNLHILQEGFNFYIFAWETLRKATAIDWRAVGGGEVTQQTRKLIDIDLANAEGTGTNISVGEIFNQLKLTCNTEAIEYIVSNPLDSADLTTPYDRSQLYLTEYMLKNNEKINKFTQFVNGLDSGNKDGTISDWYVRVKDNPYWIFPEPGTGVDLVEKFCRDKKNQHDLPNYLAQSPGAALISLGKIDRSESDNSVKPSIDMTDYLVVAVNGNGNGLFGNEEGYPTDQVLLDSVPVAVYNGNPLGASLSPSDEKVTNYIVISGKIVLNPNRVLTIPYDMRFDFNSGASIYATDADGKKYQFTECYYKAETPTALPVHEEGMPDGLFPYTNRNIKRFEYKYGGIGNDTDTVSKVGVLSCMLIVGDKCLVETFGGRGQGGIKWQTYKTLNQCESVDEYYQQSFTIGFDPKIGDYLIGTEFDIQNTVSFDMGIDATGMAIPVTKGNALRGDVHFMILGPTNYVWGNVTRRHKTWFRSEKWDVDSVKILPYVSNICLKDFSIKIHTDNAGLDNLADENLIYISDTGETFVNCKDDLNFDICSALTSEECQALGIMDHVNLSTAVETATGIGLLKIYDHTRQESAKPEQMYVDSYYNEYSRPLVLMNQELTDKESVTGFFNIYRHPAMPGKTFCAQGISRDLIEGVATLTIKEIWHD